jgi:hypothetical protein
MERPESRRIAEALSRRIGTTETSAPQIADAVVGLWREIERELTPIVGTRGVAALSGRAVFLAGSKHSWLSPAPESGPLDFDLGRLHSSIAASEAPTASAGSIELLDTFRDLLISMIGTALTDRLLSPVWDFSPSGQPARDIQS